MKPKVGIENNTEPQFRLDGAVEVAELELVFSFVAELSFDVAAVVLLAAVGHEEEAIGALVVESRNLHAPEQETFCALNGSARRHVDVVVHPATGGEQDKSSHDQDRQQPPLATRRLAVTHCFDSSSSNHRMVRDSRSA